MLKRLFFAAGLLFATAGVSAQPLNLLPQPKSVERAEGDFYLTPTTGVMWVDDASLDVAKFYCEKLQRATGRKVRPVRYQPKQKRQKLTTNYIAFEVDTLLDMGPEAYRLQVDTNRVLLQARTADGLFWALQTFFQLCPPDIENQTAFITSDRWRIPCMTIEDEPRFAHRGVMLDPCRHWLPVNAIKKQIDMLATYKFNRLHLHLTEDQGWRFEVKKYPRLTEVGAWRDNGHGEKYGGFFTQDELRDIVAYAKQRHIEVIPELELPGHELAAISAYPELSCKGDSTTARNVWGVEDVVMCPGKDTMFVFLQNVIDEMVDIFPSTYFHIGGDESPRKEWKTCPNCQARMKELGFTREAQLQDYIIERIGAYLTQKGKRFIGWDEILEGGNLEPSAIVMSWRGEKGGIEAAKKNHQAIMCPSSKGLYFDHYQGDPFLEPISIGGNAPLEKVYAYDPVPEELKKAGKEDCILGVQGNCWSEYITGPARLEYRLYPRALALAEIAWSQPEKKDFRDFCRRLDGDAAQRLNAHYINYYVPMVETPGYQTNYRAFEKSLDITLATQRSLPIVYQTDGTSPTAASPRYTSPIRFTSTSQLKTAVLMPGGIVGPVRTIYVTKQNPAPAARVGNLQPGLDLKVWRGSFENTSEFLSYMPDEQGRVIKEIGEIRSLTKTTNAMRGVEDYAAVAEGYFWVPESGVYEFSTVNRELYIDGMPRIDNSQEYAPRETRGNVELCLAKGYHRIKVVFVGGIFGGWPTYWDNGAVNIRKAGGQWQKLEGESLFH